MGKYIIRIIAIIRVYFRFMDISREARLSIIEYKSLHIPTVEEICFDIELKKILNNNEIQQYG